MQLQAQVSGDEAFLRLKERLAALEAAKTSAEVLKK